MSDLQSQDYIRISASTATPASARNHEAEVAKLIDVTRCIGCKACQSACMEWNNLRGEIGQFEGTYTNPPDLDPHTWTLMRFTEYENPKGDLEWLIRKDGCMHCEDPGCLKACPAPGAIVQYANGIVDFISENCIGCGYCVKGCPFDIPRVSEVDRKSYKCTLCSDRVAVGLEPACVKACPTGAIMFGSKTDMTAWAGERVEDLKSRGFENAGLYDPPGVSGTHVMYVLHHADQPSLYAGLPDNPHISIFVDAWKGFLKPLAVAGIVFTAVAGFLHWVVTGTKRGRRQGRPGGGRLHRAEWRVRRRAEDRRSRRESRGGRQMKYPEGTLFGTLLRRAAQSLDQRRPASSCSRSPGFPCFTRCCSGFGAVRRRPVGAGGPSLVGIVLAPQLCRTDRAVLARQLLEPRRHRLDAVDLPGDRE